MSHPARGAWIETASALVIVILGGSHPARGAWIETRQPVLKSCRNYSRTPPGVRGLKLLQLLLYGRRRRSHPARGAWIETLTAIRFPARVLVAPRPGCVD